jgi:D-glycero-D-manno-heptose 1,7-bisphosphate phosphatase
MNKALFLDRDGVINEDYGYVSQIKNFDFIDGIFTLCRAAVNKGYKLIVVTNQAGIGRGYYGEHDFEVLTDWMKSQFVNEKCELASVYYCPTHPEYGIGRYKIESLMRKPNPGMLLCAEKEFNLDLSDSILIGDSHTDILAGERAGLKACILFDPNNTSLYPNSVKRLEDAVDFL